MKTNTLRIVLIVLVALLALTMVGCKGESSPTAPPTTSTVPPGGTVTPPTGASINLTVSNANPLVSSKVTITATVSQNGAAVPDGTAVQFTSTLGTFADTGTNTTIRTTTGGVATASLSSSTSGAATITATVNNVTKSTTVTFSTAPVVPIPPSTAPTITSVCLQTGVTCTTPAIGIPNGGQQVVITGKNFRIPVRVLFDPGNGLPAKEGFVNSVTDTQIVVTTPPFDVSTGQQLPVTITVLTEAGTTTEQKVSATNAFTYQVLVLTPVVRSVSPTSGPIDGGTIVSIFGDGFESTGVQVFFNAAEAHILKVTFNQIDVVTPTARDTSPNGSLPVTGFVDVKVRNVGSGKETTFQNAFRYIAKMAITAFAPGSGTAFGGTKVTIDGVGFNDPIAISIGGLAAQPISVSGTQIVAITSRTPVPCTPPSAPIVITNVDNGDSASSTVPFTYIAEKPLITNVSPLQAQPGQTVTVTVIKPGVGLDGTAVIRFTMSGGGTFTIFPTPGVINDPFGPTNFNLTVPTPPLSAFPTEACTTGGGLAGTRPTPLNASITFTNVTTGCTDTVNNFQILPPTNTCTATAIPPSAVVSPTTLCPNGFGSVTVGNNSSQLITMTNTASGAGAQPLAVTNAVISGADASMFTVTPTTATVAPGQASPFNVKFTPTSTGLKAASLRFFTNDPARPTIDVCLEGTGQ